MQLSSDTLGSTPAARHAPPPRRSSWRAVGRVPWMPRAEPSPAPTPPQLGVAPAAARDVALIPPQPCPCVPTCASCTGLGAAWRGLACTKPAGAAAFSSDNSDRPLAADPGKCTQRRELSQARAPPSCIAPVPCAEHCTLSRPACTFTARLPPSVPTALPRSRARRAPRAAHLAVRPRGPRGPARLPQRGKHLRALTARLGGILAHSRRWRSSRVARLGPN